MCIIAYTHIYVHVYCTCMWLFDIFMIFCEQCFQTVICVVELKRAFSIYPQCGFDSLFVGKWSVPLLSRSVSIVIMMSSLYEIKVGF